MTRSMHPSELEVQEKYIQPLSMREARKRLQDSISEVQQIQSNLGNRDQRKLDGTRMNGHEYFTWRNNTTTRLNHVLKIQRKVKAWMGEQDVEYQHFYLLTYMTRLPGEEFTYREELIDQSPISWLADIRSVEDDPREYHIVNVNKISEQQYEEFEDQI